MKYFQTFMLLLVSWLVLIGLVIWLGFWPALTIYLTLGAGVGLLLIFFPETFIKYETSFEDEENNPYPVTSLDYITDYLEQCHPGHRILHRRDTYESKKNGIQTRTLLYSHSLSLQDWIDVVEFYDLDAQGWQLYTGRNGSYGLKKYEKA